MSIPIKSSDGFVFWVKEEFVKKCPSPHQHMVYDLINNYSLINYLHKPDGPAVPSSNSYFLHGTRLSEEEIKTVQYTKKLENILND
jgi:hypothetical protein